MIYVAKTTSSSNYSKPDDDIPIKAKNREWLLANFKYFYGQYISDQCGITIEDAKHIQLLRRYMDGSQPTENYKKKYLNASKGTRKNEYGHINFEDTSSPMPKIVDKILGMFISQEYSTKASCTNEFARQYRIKDAARKYAFIALQETRELLNILKGANKDSIPLQDPSYGYISRDVEEIDVIASAGSYKLPYEIGSEKVIDFSKKASGYRHFERKALRDLLCGFTASREVVSDNIIKWRNVDITDVIIEYSKNTHFNNSDYVGIQETWSIADLRKKGFKEEDLKKMASSNFSHNSEILGGKKQNKAFQQYDVYYKGSNSYGYDSFKIPVIYFAFKSVDTKYHKKVETKAGDSRYYDSKFGRVDEHTITDSLEKIYEGRWIIGTDNVFDDGVMAYPSRNNLGGVKMPVHVVRLEGKSIIERSIHILDEFAMLGYKLQNALAKSQGSQYILDITAFEDIASNSGGKLQPLDLMDMLYQGAGLPYRSIPLDEQVNYSRPAPVSELKGGIGTYLNELITLKQMYTNDLVEITGVALSQSNTPVGIAKIAVSNTIDVLKPLYDLFLESKEYLSYNTVYRVQLLLTYNKKSLQIYSDAIGKHYAEYLKQAAKSEPLEMGITFEVSPSDELKANVLEAARSMLQAGKNGVPLLKVSEYLYMVDNINNQSGLKEARLVIAHREKQDEILAIQKSQANVQQQSAAIERQIQVKGAIDGNKIQSQSQADLTKVKLTKDLDLRNAQEIEEGKVVINAIHKGIDQSREDELRQEQQQIDKYREERTV